MRNTVLTALFTAILCILAPVSLPIGPVPISLATFVLMLWGYILGWKRGLLTYVLYLAIGFIGLPVFSNFGAGPGVLIGPTGGYIYGYALLVFVAGILGENYREKKVCQVLGLVLATILIYACGTAWFCYSQKVGPLAAMSICVLPFLPGDLVKIIAVLILGPRLRKQLSGHHFQEKGQ